MGKDMTGVGISLPPKLLDDLDDMAERWDQREAGPVYRSDVAREALALGLEALDAMDKPEYRRLTTQDRKAVVRQALIDFDWTDEA